MFVVGVGADVEVFTDVMQGIAYYGSFAVDISDAGVPDDPALWYPAADAATLSSALEEIESQAIPCTLGFAWGDIPETGGDGDPILKGCDFVTMKGTSETSSEAVYLAYSRDCSGEDAAASAFAWRWQGIDAEQEDLGDYSLAQCATVELCPLACSALVEGHLVDLTAQIGCSGC